MSEPKPVEFYFDYASPWAYLADRVLGRRLAGIEIVYKPTYIRGLEMFSKGMPFVANKLAYLGLDWKRCLELEQVAGNSPTRFPINGLYALRAALYAQENGGFEKLHDRLFRATWHDDIEVSDKSRIIELGVAAGQDEEAFATGIDSPAIKKKLRDDTEAAQTRGLFGLPSFFVEGELFWGYDRLDLVAEAARG